MPTRKGDSEIKVRRRNLWARLSKENDWSNVRAMLSTEQCFSKADAMDGAAMLAPPAFAPYYRELAEIWRWVAAQAEWQDTFSGERSSVRLH